jgi:hypothetical protein
MDMIGWYIVNLHQLVGHDKAAVVIGAPPGDRAACVICQHERNPTAESRAAVLRALAPRG